MSDTEGKAGTSRSGASSARSKSNSRLASASPQPAAAAAGGRSASASSSSRRRSSAKPASAKSGAASGSSSSKKKGKKGSRKKKKKKKPIVEEPKFVRDLIAKVEAGDVEWVRHFLASAEYVAKYDWLQTAGEALVMAALKNRPELVTMLLEAGAPPNLAAGKPLQRASFQGALEAAEVLIRAGADVNAKSTFAEYVPLHYAAQVGCAPIVALLLASGAAVDTPCHPEQCGIFNGWTALHFAADAGHLLVVQQLLEAAATVDAPNSNGDTALSIAAERGRWDVARWLVAAGANIHAPRRGLSVVQWAVYRGDHEAVQFLVSYGAVPALGVRANWFPAGAPSLKELIYKQFSEDVYDEIDLAIYRGGKQALEREAKRKLIAGVTWETNPGFDPYSFDTTPQLQIRSFPPHIVNMISSYEM